MMFWLRFCAVLLLMGKAWAQSTSWTVPEAVIRAAREVEAPTPSAPRRLAGESIQSGLGGTNEKERGAHARAGRDADHRRSEHRG